MKQYLVRAKPQRTAPCGGPPSFSFLFYNRPHSITLQVTDEIGFCFTILFHYWQAQRTRITSTHCPLRRASEPFFLINAPIISSCRWLPWFVFPYSLSLLAGTTYKNYLNALPLAEGLLNTPFFFFFFSTNFCRLLIAFPSPLLCFFFLFLQAPRTRITWTHCLLRRASDTSFFLDAPILSPCR